MRWHRIVDVGAVVIEGRQRADHAAHHRHRVRVAAEAAEEAAICSCTMVWWVMRVVELGLLRGGRQFAVQQQVADLQEIAVLGQLLDRIAAIEQDALVAVDVGDVGFAARGRGEAGIVGEDAGLAVELADVDHIRPDRAVENRELAVLVADGDGAGFASWRRVLASMVEPSIWRRAVLVESCWPGAVTPGGRSVFPADFCVSYTSVHCKIMQIANGAYRYRSTRRHFIAMPRKTPV